jgi:hypothetical protein
MNRAARRTWRNVSRDAHQGSLTADDLEGAIRTLAEPGAPASSQDDVQWLQTLALVLRKVEQSPTAEHFSIPDGGHRDWGVPFEKVHAFYERMARVGVVTRIQWFLGGGAFVKATDLRAIREYIHMQARQRLEPMGLLQPPPGNRLRKARSWIGQNVWKVTAMTLSTILASLVVGYLLGANR